MIDVFNVTKLEALGYAFNSTQVYANPMDAKFAALPYKKQDYSLDAEMSAVSSLASLNAYAPATSLMAAQSAYWATATVSATSSKGGLFDGLTGLFGRRVAAPTAPPGIIATRPTVIPEAAPTVTPAPVRS